jgi:hypothetical protein
MRYRVISVPLQRVTEFVDELESGVLEVVPL